MGAVRPAVECLYNLLSSSHTKSGGIFECLNANYSDFR